MKWVAFLATILAANAAMAQAPSRLEAREAAERYLRKQLASGACAEHYHFVRIVAVEVAPDPVDDLYPATVAFEVGLLATDDTGLRQACIPGKPVVAPRGQRGLREYAAVLRLSRGVGTAQVQTASN